MFQLLGLLCLGMAWLVPNHYPPWSSFYNDSTAAVGLIFLTVGVWPQLRERGSPAAAWIVIGVAAIPLLQWELGWLIFSGDAIVSTLYLAGLGVAIAVGHAWARRDHRDVAIMLSWTTVLAAMASSALALSQGLQIGRFGIWALDAMPGMRAYANLGQPNNLATLIGLGAVGLLLLREQGRIGMRASVLTLLLLVIAGGMTQSRTALLFGPVVLVIVLWARHRGVRLQVRSRTIAIATVGHWVTTWAWPLLQAQLGLTLTDRASALGLYTPRLAVWRILFDALADSPWRGFGWLQTGAAQLAAADRHPPVGEMWLQGHNLFVDLLIWCGYPLGLALCGLLLYWFLSRLWRVNTLQALVGMLSIGVLGTHAMLELPHHYAYFLIPLGLWIGQVEHAEAALTPVKTRWTLAPATVALCLLAGVWWNYPAVEEDFRLVRFESFNIGSLRAEQPAPDAPFLSSLTAFLRFARTTAAPGMSRAQLDQMSHVVNRYPYASSMARYARALALNDRTEEAEQIFRKIRYIHGAALYRNLSRDLSDRIDQGETQLKPLAQRLAQ
jgi:hypothetical protein